jgi:hypothetical protein
MIDQALAKIFFNQWVVLLFISAMLLLLGEISYRLGRAIHRRNPGASQGHGSSAQGAVLGLLGLLLGFSFAMAVGRFDARRALVVEEANSIGTTWLRTDFLAAPFKNEIRELLIEYTDIKLAAFDQEKTPTAAMASKEKIARIHDELWKSASFAVAERNTPVVATFITSLNETIDLDANRRAALHNHVPGAVWLLLFTVAGCGVWASCHGCGTAGHRSVFNQVLFPILIAVVITLISDIDRAHKGLIGLNHEPFEALLESMKP